MGISWSSTRRTAPPTVPSDTIIPVHYWDISSPGRSAAIFYLLQFDDVLDAEKLKGSLRKLLGLKGWRKLGARIRINVDNGKLDYHIPAYFDEKRVPFSFHHENFDISVNEHPRASRFRLDPNARTPHIQCREADWIDFMWQSGDPKRIEDYLYSDKPILGFRMTTFLDATLLAFSWPHLSFDAMGHALFLQAWSLILNGRDDEVPQFLGFEKDPLATLGTQPVEKYKHADNQFGIPQAVILGLRYVYDRFRNRRLEEDGRTICLPAAYVRHLCETARSELKATQPDGPVSFLSEGDIICAWWARQLAQIQISEPSSREVAIYNIFGLRGRLEQELLPPGHAYVGNNFCTLPAFMTASDILTKPLGFVAAAIRKAYMDLGTRGQIEALMSLNRAAKAKGGVAFFGDPWMKLTMCTNWTKADLFNVDFSGALPQRLPKGERTSGKPSFVQAHVFLKGLTAMNCFIILGKDIEGNICLYGYMKEKDWVAVNKRLEDTIKRVVGRRANTLQSVPNEKITVAKAKQDYEPCDPQNTEGVFSPPSVYRKMTPEERVKALEWQPAPRPGTSEPGAKNTKQSPKTYKTRMGNWLAGLFSNRGTWAGLMGRSDTLGLFGRSRMRSRPGH
ncbi:uncharacterized protein GGS22DRAFT_182958 [Annulohypoxylon maeteangense]|uniref:uncharacterized protein n=1 Tax=Annulohypoxylon maeteangense TaxID=1927788 RepID=UPI00200781AB|nr:uncharacterized protein GGS22DRAFT_182958 [Annulohypoxylon maeteangense]KAI0889615.1 hypothetical protein GGS22DRAFT_182958 [Annulohypoxylon maeteangense]